MQKIIQSIIKRLKNPAFWTGLISLILLIFSSAGLNFNDMTTWNALWGAIITILSNPVSIVAIIGSLVGISADTSSKGFLDGTKDK